MKQRLIRYAIMVIALGVFVYSAYRLTLIYIESKDSLEVYDEVKNMFLSGEAGGEAETDEKGMTISNSNNGGKFVWDYDKMLAYNPEAVGYIRQDNGEYIDIDSNEDNINFSYNIVSSGEVKMKKVI